MIKPARNFLITAFFERYINYSIRKNFHEIHFTTIDVNPKKSILLLANHYSWWDGFLIFYLNKKLFKKKAHVMIIEATARKFPFMKYLGAYTVNKGTKDMIVSLDYTAGLLANPGNLVLLFPQGKIYSNFADEIVFNNGLSRIIKKAKGQFEMVFAVSFIETLHHKKPSVNMSLKTAHAIDSVDEIHRDFNDFYRAAKEKQSKIIV